ncbi:MAG: penicillin-binding protein 2 [Bacteroidales bacterium]|jgi:penicillin-binding protein 2|nr:penicillin-binding protein 2 [Bacteroidales bacterium]
MQKLTKRQIIIFIFIGAVALYWLRLFYIQIIDDKYNLYASNNAFRYKIQYPGRGLMYDRNGELLVYNEPIYDLMVVPMQVDSAMKWDLLSKILQLSSEECKNRLKQAKKFSRYAPSIFEKQISKEMYGQLQEYLSYFNGFYIQSRTLRRYPKPIAAHVLGSVGETDEIELSSNSYYQLGDYIGKSGLEKFYEEELRGKKGVNVVMVDVHNRERGSYKNGKYDSISIPGNALYTTLSISLQEYAEELMKNKRGSIIAIEPSTGEVLAYVSSPAYDPNLLVGRVRSTNYRKLLNDPSKPLFDRAIMAPYPPGSIFKLVHALIGLQEGVITPNFAFSCDKSLVDCHNHPSAMSVSEGIKMSCNPYFYGVFRKIVMQGKDKNSSNDSKLGLEEWKHYTTKFGLGTQLGLDIANVKSGLIPDSAYYNKRYKSPWNFYTIYSIAIGQGEVGLIPLQMANLAVIMANRGFYYTPHLVRSIGENRHIPNIDTVRHWAGIDSVWFVPVVKGMYGVVHEPGGTARRARIDDIVVCGKTGTAQNPHGEDHAVFVGFAPMDNPQIAISVFIENSGFGGSWSAPIASLLIEKYLTGEVKRADLERQMREAVFNNGVRR